MAAKKTPNVRRPNIPVLSSDDIGMRNLSCYPRGRMGNRTPNVERISGEDAVRGHAGRWLRWTRGGRGMHMRRVGLVVLVAGLLIPAGCTRQKDMSVTEAGNPSGRIHVTRGEDFTLTLPSNRTTGYSWRMGELTPGVVQLLDHDYRQAANTPAVVGAGGEERWTFKAVDAGQVTIRFEYVRPWELDVPAIKKAEFVVTSTR